MILTYPKSLTYGIPGRYQIIGRLKREGIYFAGAIRCIRKAGRRAERRAAKRMLRADW